MCCGKEACSCCDGSSFKHLYDNNTYSCFAYFPDDEGCTPAKGIIWTGRVLWLLAVCWFIFEKSWADRGDLPSVINAYRGMAGMNLIVDEFIFGCVFAHHLLDTVARRTWSGLGQTLGVASIISGLPMIQEAISKERAGNSADTLDATGWYLVTGGILAWVLVTFISSWWNVAILQACGRMIGTSGYKGGALSATVVPLETVAASGNSTTASSKSYPSQTRFARYG